MDQVLLPYTCYHGNPLITPTLINIICYRSMIPDVVDYASLHYGIRREELYYSFFVFGNKFGSGITLGISTGIYKLA